MGLEYREMVMPDGISKRKVTTIRMAGGRERFYKGLWLMQRVQTVTTNEKEGENRMTLFIAVERVRDAAAARVLAVLDVTQTLRTDPPDITPCQETRHNTCGLTLRNWSIPESFPLERSRETGSETNSDHRPLFGTVNLE